MLTQNYVHVVTIPHPKYQNDEANGEEESEWADRKRYIEVSVRQKELKLRWYGNRARAHFCIGKNNKSEACMNLHMTWSKVNDNFSIYYVTNSRVGKRARMREREKERFRSEEGLNPIFVCIYISR